jgi:hypothetical protein
MKKSLVCFISLIIIGISMTLFAGNESVQGKVTLNTTPNPVIGFAGVCGSDAMGMADFMAAAAPTPSSQDVMILCLPEKAKRFINEGSAKLKAKLAASSAGTGGSTGSSSTVDLGKITYSAGYAAAILAMPVLNQAQTETCATFSTTAAVDITSENGSDYYSIYDSLKLGYALSQGDINLNAQIENAISNAGQTAFPNPWNGSYPNIILAQYISYGMVPGRDSYDQNGTFGSSESKTAISSSLSDYKTPGISFTLLYNAATGMSSGSGSYATLIKNALDAGDLVVIGIPIYGGIQGSNMGMTSWIYPDSSGNYYLCPNGYSSFSQDVWCKGGTSSQLQGGHAILVVGYIENENYGGGGYFIIRNSWGVSNGVNGNNFLSFDFVSYMSWIACSVGSKGTAQSL